MRVRALSVVIAVALAAGCATGGTPVEPAPPAAQPAAQEIKPAAVAEEPKAAGDYLDAGLKIAAVRLVSWEDTAFMAWAYPARIEQEASPATENKFKVAPVVPVEGAAAAESELWKWTPFVFDSRPAVKEELAVGQLVLCVDVDRPLSVEELKNASWRLRTVTGLSKLFQDLVELGHYNTYYHEQRTQLVHAGNIRLVENPLDEEALRFPD